MSFKVCYPNLIETFSFNSSYNLHTIFIQSTTLMIIVSFINFMWTYLAIYGIFNNIIRNKQDCRNLTCYNYLPIHLFWGIDHGKLTMKKPYYSILCSWVIVWTAFRWNFHSSNLRKRSISLQHEGRDKIPSCFLIVLYVWTMHKMVFDVLPTEKMK